MIEKIPAIIEIIGIVIALAAAIAAMTPTPKDDGIVRKDPPSRGRARDEFWQC